ncbi:AAA family ATPase [Massilia solisilvae]|uniref:AAA family ATPase n=1 Tax=Massilia solisilvae TaxID=1811225 RepID=A0ABT2BIQ1_9BURK|nr:AAA family ATPase [Massilia solisilvae]MCS0608391.1 AAA family ATPase [Massilia solisilvae]
MKLLSLKIYSNGRNGLESDELFFGEHITQLYGPNGCGKTPTVQSLAFCLGYPADFREEIYRRCSKAALTFSLNNGVYEVSRVIASRDVAITVRSPLGEVSDFYSEGDYSEFMFELLGLQYPNLISTGDKLSKPFISTFLPLFYLDQDDGYRDFYSPKGNQRFIKDQFSEMMRLLFDQPVKNSFDAKKDRIDTKQELARLDELVQKRQSDVEFARRNLDESEELQEINEKIDALERELQNLSVSGNEHDGAVSVFSRLIANNLERIRTIQTDLSEIGKRERSVNRIINEINLEINALSLNEESRRIFLSFSEICESAGCQLFSVSSSSYAKNLLYLKDQIKDLERNSDEDRRKIEALTATRESHEKQNEELIKERDLLLKSNEMKAVIDTISRIKSEIFSLQTKKADFEKYSTLQTRYFDAMTSRNKVYEKYQALSGERSFSSEIIRLRSDLRTILLRWLDVINTDNIDKNISFKDDFQPVFGSETVSQLKGSTKVRAVLAFHAALLELAMVRQRGIFPFLILDTPKQHDINNEDLGAYVSELKVLAKRFNTQIVFSNTEFHYIGDEQDEEWVPHYPGEKHNMFYRNTP